MASINNFYLIYYVWQKVLKVSTNLRIHKNIKAIQIILSAEVVGKESFVHGAI
jgi:hypothetical protein